MSNKRRFLVAAVAVVIFASASCVWAWNDGTWIGTLNPGDWSDPGNWDSGTIADGDGATADFTINVPTGGVDVINVDIGRAGQLIGLINFVDADGALPTPGSYLLQGTTTLNMQYSFLTPIPTSQISVSPIYDTVSGAELVAAEISAPISVVSGTSLSIIGSGRGTMKFSGNTTVVNGDLSIGNMTNVILTGNMILNNGNTTINGSTTVNVNGTGILSSQTTAASGQTTIGGGGTVNLSGSSQLKSAGGTFIGNNTDNGTLNVGLTSADSATATLTGGFLMGGGTGGTVGTINVHGTLPAPGTATLTTGSSTLSTLGDWGAGNGVMNIYDSAIVQTGELRIAPGTSSSGTVTLKDSSQLNSTIISIGYNCDPSVAGTGGTVTVNNNAKVTTTGMAEVGNQGNGILNINDSSSVAVGGTLYVAHNSYWVGTPCANTGTINIGGVSVAGPLGTPSLTAGAIDMSGNFAVSPTTNNGDVSNINISGNSIVHTIKAGANTGNFIVCSSWGVSTVTISDDAQVTVDGQLGLGLPNNWNTATVNISGTTAKLTAGEIDMATTLNSWSNSTTALNISGNAQVSTSTTGGATGNFNTGMSTGWNPTATISVLNTSSLHIAGNSSLYQAAVVVGGSGQMSVNGNVILGVVNANWSSLDVSGSSNPSSIGGNLTVNLANITTSAISNAPIAGGVDMAGTLYLNGGQITPSVSSTVFMQGLAGAKIGQYGGKFMTWSGSANTNITIAQDLGHDAGGPAIDGGLTVIGNGSVTVNGALTYTGPTTIDGVTLLQVNSPGATTLASINGTGTGLDKGRMAIGNATHVASVGVTGSALISNLTVDPLSKIAIGGDLTNVHGGIIAGAINNLVVPGGVDLTGTLYLNGSQITPTASNPTFMQGLAGAKIGANGVSFMTWSGTANTAITIGQDLGHDAAGPAIDGGLTVVGNGSVTMNGALTYTGPTTIDGVTLLQVNSLGATTLASINGTGTGLDKGELGIGIATRVASVGVTGSVLISDLTVDPLSKIAIGGDLTNVHGGISASAINNLVVAGGVDLTGTLYLDGSQITPTASNATFMQGLAGAKIGANGVSFMTWNGSTTTAIAIAQGLGHDAAGPAIDGGLTVIGNGSVTMNGALTYTGQTTIDGVTLLQVNSPGATTLASINGTGAGLDKGKLGIGDATHVASVGVTGSVLISNLTVDPLSKIAIGGDLTNVHGGITAKAINNLVVAGGVDLTGTLYLDGSEITPTASNPTFMQGLAGAKIGANGVSFMTWNGSATTAISMAQALQHDSAGPATDGGQLVIGNGSVTETGALTYTGVTKIDGVSELHINTIGNTVLAAITNNGTPGTGILGVGDGVNTTHLTVTSVNVGTLTIGAHSTLTIAPILGGPSAGGGLAAVPEPGTFAMLAIAALGLMAAAWRRRK
ncbi:MAG: PEP-CTERM sorting domain-containing protein [Thermoguttaceae bacterium]|jgi:autotransporter-associated beta strand protein